MQCCSGDDGDVVVVSVGGVDMVGTAVVGVGVLVVVVVVVGGGGGGVGVVVAVSGAAATAVIGGAAIAVSEL